MNFKKGVNNLRLRSMNQDSTTSCDLNIEFWHSEKINNNGDVKWKINHLKLIEFIRFLGYRRFDIGKEYIFTHVTNRIICQVPATIIQDAVIDYIQNLSYDAADNKHSSGITKEELLGKFYTSPTTYINERKLSLLGTISDLKVMADSKEKSYIYYSNGFVEVSKDGYKLKSYDALDGYIFQNQRKSREFEQHSSDGMFKKFVQNICGSKEDRFFSLQTIIGYLLHGYFDTKMKAVNLTDSEISEVAQGRTGKTLLGRAISQVKNVCEISGKDFDPANKHKYASANLDTQIIFLNDLRKRFDFENLFNDISDAITIDKKNLQPFSIRAKMLIAANDTFQIEGASARDRVIEFELANYYNADYSPGDEFNCWFFTDWDKNEWLRFDNFMIDCIQKYLQHGVQTVEPINLNQRKKIDHTHVDFVEFIDEKVKNGELILDVEYDKRKLHQEFLEKYPEHREHRVLRQSAYFTRYLKSYANYSSELMGTIREKRSNGSSYICFEKRKSQDNQQKSK